MAKKIIYHIEGFDCLACATKAEDILSNNDKILSVNIDVNNEKLFITYKDEPLTLDEIHQLIGRIDGSIIHVELEKAYRKRIYKKGFTKKEWILLTRVLVSLLLMFVAKFVFEEHFEQLFVPYGIILYCLALAIIIYDIIYRLFMNIIKKQNPVDMNLLMVIFAAGMFLSYLVPSDLEPAFFDGCMVVALYQVGELVEKFATTKAKNTIASVIDKRAEFANRIDDNGVSKVSPDELKIGDQIIINEGEIVPVDGIILDGSGFLDTSSFTGDSNLLSLQKDMNILGGTILKEGTITLSVTKLFNDTQISKSIEMIQNSGEHKGKGDKFITKFAHIYTPIILGLGLIVFLIFGLVTQNWAYSLHQGLLILVIGCPCAIVISVPLAYTSSSALAMKYGIIIKGANILDKLSKVGTVFVDKTGTLTFSDFQIAKVVPINIEDNLFAEYMIACESRSAHPIARTLCYGQDIASLGAVQENYLEVPGYGVKTRYDNHSIIVGSYKFLNSVGIEFEKPNEEGILVFLAVDGIYRGYVVLYEYIRDEAEPLVQNLHKLGIEVVMMSGDSQSNTDVLAKILQIEKCYADLNPEGKQKLVKEALEKKGKKNVLVAGFDNSDVPSLEVADIGVSNGELGADNAVNASDIVLMKHYPGTIYEAIKISQITNRTVLINIIVTLALKFIAAILIIFVQSLSEYIGIIMVLADIPLTIIMTLHSLSILIRKIK